MINTFRAITRGVRRLPQLAAPLIIGAAVLLCGCESEDDIEANQNQQDTIISYLESSHTPTLIAESEISNSLSTDPAFYTRYGDYAFRYIEDYYNVERETKSEIKSGSRVIINFSLFEFSGSAIEDDELPLYTNESAYETPLNDAGLNTELWTFSPMEIVIGETTLLSSIQDGLISCKESDKVEIYMTRDMAYGDAVIGLAEQYSMLVMFCTILKVTN